MRKLDQPTINIVLRNILNFPPLLSMGLTLLISYSLFGHNDHRHHQVKPSESAEPDEQEDIRVRKEIRLYRCSDQDGTLRVSEVKSGPLLQSDLESTQASNCPPLLDYFQYYSWVLNCVLDQVRFEFAQVADDSFIVDNGSWGIWVWVGKRASAKERTEAMRNAQGFIKKKGEG